MLAVGPIASPRRSSMLAGSVSLALHGALIGLAVGLTGALVGQARPPVLLTNVEVIDAVPLPAPPVPPQVAPLSPVAEPRAAAQSRRSPEPAQRAPARPTAVKDLLADVTMRYDDRDDFTDKDASDAPADGERAPLTSAVGNSLSHIHEDGVARLQMPAPASASLARQPRAKHDYHKLRMHSVKQFAGQRIKMLILIDEHGAVSDVRILQGIESHLDQRTVELVRRWQFEPALDDVGTPVRGTQNWEILVVDEAKESIKGSIERGFY
jgi:TonB family protein